MNKNWGLINYSGVVKLTMYNCRADARVALKLMPKGYRWRVARVRVEEVFTETLSEIGARWKRTWLKS